MYLYAANTTGYGNASVSLLKSPGYVMTDSNGNFSITGDYTCPSSTAQVYLYALGGNPGLGEGTNSAAGMLAALGTCPASGTLSSTLFITINEVSTIATAYAIAGYATDPTHVSSSGSALAKTGIANAFATVTNLETLSTGVALANTPGSTTPSTATVPQNLINTLANILAACVNSSGTVTGGANPTPCDTLFTNALSGGTTGTQPADTATAALNIAHNPWANITNLFSLQTANSPFQTDLSSAPNDFTVTIGINGGGQDLSTFLAIDAAGDVWVVGENGTVTEFNPLGVTFTTSDLGFGGTCITEPFGLAIDSSGNAWVANQAPDSICEFSSAGVPNNTPFTGGGLKSPHDIAIDGSGNMWVTNSGNSSISKFNSSGSPLSSSSGYTGAGLDTPYGIAVDASGNIWATNYAGPSISELSSTGLAVGTTPFKGGGLADPIDIAIDGSGNAWIANRTASSVSKFNSSGTAQSGSSGYTGGGLDDPFGIAVDSNGNIWATNYLANSISEMNSSGTAISGTNGYQSTLTGLASFYSPYNIAIDGSGNVWVTNTGPSSITEFVGAASPVVTPRAANLQSPYNANNSAVNKP